MRWRRLSATLRSGPLRRIDDWPLIVWPDVEIGAQVPLIRPAYIHTAVSRIVVTTMVAQIHQAPEAAAEPNRGRADA
jgi:hypothetical protein